MNSIKADDIIAIDFETYYDKEYSLKKLSTYNYIYDERFDPYLVSAYSKDFSFVGPPSKLDWQCINGKVVVMHNASFDELVMQRLMELDVIPETVKPAQVLCTADMVAYLGCRRDLKTAARELLGRDMSKAVRSNMLGKNYRDAVAAGMEDELLKYGLDDSINTYDLAVKYINTWPENERRLSNLNRAAGLKGFMIDEPMVDAAIKTLRNKLQETEDALPWVEAEGKKPTSPHAIRAQGRKEGIEVPASLAKDSLEVIAWQEKYEDKFPWVKAISEYRSINTLLKRVESIKAGIRPDGTMPYQLKYCGASTGRFSGGGEGGGKFNMQNMPRDEMFGVNLRHMFKSRPGKKFVLADFSQIEARILLWAVQDWEFLDLINTHGNIYIAYAAKAWGREIKRGTNDYQLAKASVLLLGYHGGWKRFQDTAAKAPYFLKLSDEEALDAVTTYRTQTPLVVNHWKEHQQWLNFSTTAGDAFHGVELKSGRILKYHNPRNEWLYDDRFKKNMMETTVNCELGGHRTRLHAGILTNNEIQAMARDVLRDAWLALDDAGYDVLLTVHDELDIEIDEDMAEEHAPKIIELMKTSSPWAIGCPLDAEVTISKTYCK